MSAIFNSTNNTSTNTPSATEDAYKTTATITKTLSPTPTPTPQTLLEVSGSGTKTTQAFTASGDWNMNWSYDCKNFGNQGNFQVYVYNQDGTDAYQDAGVNELGATGNDTEYYHNGGTFYLVVNSECSWNINVKG